MGDELFDQNTVNDAVTEITAEFILAHKDVLFKVNGTIALQANWEEEK